MSGPILTGFLYSLMDLGLREHHSRVALYSEKIASTFSLDLLDEVVFAASIRDKDIPFAARVLAVADAFDAMTSFRPYRPSLSMEEALEELQRNSGKQFDPEVVAAFLEVMKASKEYTESIP